MTKFIELKVVYSRNVQFQNVYSVDNAGHILLNTDYISLVEKLENGCMLMVDPAFGFQNGRSSHIQVEESYEQVKSMLQ